MEQRTFVDLFFQKHFPGATYEVRNGGDGKSTSVAAKTESDEFYCSFDLVDAEHEKFIVHCGKTKPQTFVYNVDLNNMLVDIKHEMFEAHEILHHLDVYSEQTVEIDAFLSEPQNVALFHQKLICVKNSSGNLWSVELSPLYDDPRMDDMFLSMPGLSMIWNRKQARFSIYHGHESIKQSSIDYTNGIVTVNGKILFFILNPNATFFIAEYVPEQNANDLLIYEGKIATSLGDSDSSTDTDCRFTISRLNTLPAADILMEWNGGKIEARAPLIAINDGLGGFTHFRSKRNKPGRVVGETAKFVEKNMAKKVADFHLDYLRSMELY